jgi:hypothetical protein
VNDPSAVGVVECLGHIGGDVDSVSDRKLMLSVEAILQRVAFHVGHHIEEKAVGFAGVVQWKDMRMLEVGGDLDFS